MFLNKIKQKETEVTQHLAFKNDGEFHAYKCLGKNKTYCDATIKPRGHGTRGPLKCVIPQ